MPHGAVLQVTDQVTPAFALSLVTTAVSGVVVDATRDAGGAGAKATEITGAVAVIVMVAETDFVLSVTEVATTVTEPATEGAV